MPVGAGFTDIATDRKLRTTINSHAYAVEGIYYGLVLTALATAITVASQRQMS
jgi:hypothetical protein